MLTLVLSGFLASADGGVGDGGLAPETGSSFEVVPVEALPVRVERVELTGFSWTHPSVVHRELQLDVPGVVTAEQWALGLTRLWNCGLFSRVDGRLERRPEGVVAVLELEERFRHGHADAAARSGVIAARSVYFFFSTLLRIGGSDLR